MSNHEARITKLRQIISESEARISELELQRSAALVGDDDTAIDRIDSEMRDLNSRIRLSAERIEASTQAMADEAEQARQLQLTKLAERADRARQAGEALIGKYETEAGKLADVFAKLTAVDRFIADANRTLAANQRESVPSPNAIRCRSMQTVERTVRRTVGIGEDDHPLHAVAQVDANGRAFNRLTGETIERFSELDVTVRDIIPAVSQAPLQDEVVLPAAAFGGAPIWPSRNAADPNDLLQELGLTDESGGSLRRLFARVTA